MATNSNITVSQNYTTKYSNLVHGWDTSHPTTISKKFIILIYHYLHAVTVETLNQEGFAKLFIKHIVHRFGLPRGMVADRDPRWAKTFWASVAAELKLDLLLTTSHHPQTDGQSERAIQQLVIGLRAFVRTNRASWAKWISELNFAYNST